MRAQSRVHSVWRPSLLKLPPDSNMMNDSTKVVAMTYSSAQWAPGSRRHAIACVNQGKGYLLGLVPRTRVRAGVGSGVSVRNSRQHAIACAGQGAGSEPHITGRVRYMTSSIKDL